MTKLVEKYIKIDYSRDELLTEQSRRLLKEYYLLEDEESPQEGFARAAIAYCYGDYDLAQRIYDYASEKWFMFASPVLSNAPRGYWREKDEVTDWKTHEWIGDEPKAMPISCFALEVQDTLKGQIASTEESAWLSVKGGGVGIHSSIRATSKKAPGPIPYLKTLDSISGYYRQSEVRRGSFACYMDISHPDILEFIKIRIPTGGDPTRKVENLQNFHNAVNVTEDFIQAFEANEDYNLVCPHSGEVKKTVRARKLFEEILETRSVTGEPYFCFLDVANEKLPEAQKALGLKIKGSNLCSEVFLPTNEERTFVCCLSSLNLYFYDEWQDTSIIQDLIVFLDNVLEWFITYAPDELGKAKYSAYRERALGLGTMGFHSLLQKNMIAWESGGFNSAQQMNHMVYSMIQERSEQSSRALAMVRGEAPDMVGTGLRNSHRTAIAPNANSSMIVGASPSIEPIAGNAYTHRTRVGAHLIENPELEKYLAKNFSDKEKKELWKKIQLDKGSVQRLDEIPDDVKKVFKTAWEIDQHSVVNLAEERQQYICQGQSVNLFFPSGSDKSYVASVHAKAMLGRKLKSLYYYRTGASVEVDMAKEIKRRPLKDWHDDNVCIACEG